MKPSSSQFPKSHVKISSYGKVEGKYDSDGNTDAWRERNDANDRQDIKNYNDANPKPPIKVKS